MKRRTTKRVALHLVLVIGTPKPKRRSRVDVEGRSARPKRQRVRS